MTHVISAELIFCHSLHRSIKDIRQSQFSLKELIEYLVADLRNIQTKP